MPFATAAIEPLFEQADFGFQFVNTLLELLFALLETCRRVRLGLGQELFEFAFPLAGAVVERLIVADLLASLPQCLLTGWEVAGSLYWKRIATEVGVIMFHHPNMPQLRVKE
jgi:hypothetical protein